VFGTPDEALETLRGYAAGGIAHCNVMFQPFGSERAQVAALADVAATLARETRQG
jgi:alkanesulfonate monooxygenase SsuD/methylene tetrahydromethanopterin reductase-like flavin-dependent oxidoreductase (luciferase family)